MKLLCQVCLLAVCLMCNDKMSATSDPKCFRTSMSPEQRVLFSYGTSFPSFVRPLAFYFRPQGLSGRADDTRCISDPFFYKYHLRVSSRNFCSEHFTKDKHKKVTNTEWPPKNVQYTLFTHQYLWNKFK